jgi:hypothetical protein
MPASPMPPVIVQFADVDENTRDQVIEKCSSKRLRRKLLERHNVTLQQLREIAQSLEASEKQALSIATVFEAFCSIARNYDFFLYDMFICGVK